jgi:uncharacterized protein YcbX
VFDQRSPVVESGVLPRSGTREFRAVVTALTTTPVKGTRLHTQTEIELTRAGAAGDRVFFIVDEHGKMVNGKRLGILAAVLADYDAADQRLRLRLPDGAEVADHLVDGKQVQTRFFSRRPLASLVSPLLSQALSDYAGRSLRLVRADRSLSAIDRGPRGGVSLIGDGSLTHLAALAGEHVDARRFRMLIEITGSDPHAEDELVGRRVRIGEALVEFHGHVGRCLVTSQDPDTGIANLSTLDLLAYRKGLETTEPLAFGIYGQAIEPGVVKLGDPVVSET